MLDVVEVQRPAQHLIHRRDDLAFAFGLGTGLPVWLETATKADHASSPATTYAQDRVATLTFGLSVAVSIGLFYAFAISVSQPHSNLGPVADPFHVNRALPAAGVSACFGWFAFRHVGAVSYGLAGFVVGGLAMAHHISLGLGLAAGAIFGLAPNRLPDPACAAQAAARHRRMGMPAVAGRLSRARRVWGTTRSLRPVRAERAVGWHRAGCLLTLFLAPAAARNGDQVALAG